MKQENQTYEEINGAIRALMGKAKEAGYSLFVLIGNDKRYVEAINGELHIIGIQLFQLMESDREIFRIVSKMVKAVKLSRKLGPLPTDDEINNLFNLGSIN